MEIKFHEYALAGNSSDVNTVVAHSVGTEFPDVREIQLLVLFGQDLSVQALEAVFSSSVAIARDEGFKAGYEQGREEGYYEWR